MNHNKGGILKKQHANKMSAHIAAYYTNLMNSIDTGCKMTDYCWKDLYITLIVREIL